MERPVLLCLIVAITLCQFAVSASGQNREKVYTEEQYRRALNQLDNRPYDPAYDANIDFYVRSWQQSVAQKLHGSLVVQDIFTPGDPMNPSEPGAVLKYTSRFAHASIGAYEKTTPAVLTGKQEIYYVISGTGTVSTSKSTSELTPGCAVLIPPDIEFVIENTGNRTMKLYLLVEPCPPGFDPNDDMKVVNENHQPWGSGNPHWVGLYKQIFTTASGLATLTSIITVQFNPVSMFAPHSHHEGFEEVWTTISGDGYFLLDKQVRHQPPGTAYYIPPDGESPHANINTSDDHFKLLYFARFPGR